jgi:hypothetical protein
LPGGFVKASKYCKDPTVGLKVVISGHHGLHGYNAVIRDVVHLDARGLPQSFKVKVEAMHKMETVDKGNLTIRT